MIHNWIKFNEERDSKKEILGNIKDILLELTDEGFIVDHEFERVTIPGILNYRIKIRRRAGNATRHVNHMGKFLISNVYDTLKRLEEYMRWNGYSTIVYTGKTSDYPFVDKKISLDDWIRRKSTISQNPFHYGTLDIGFE
jgi:hypothetical protein